MKNGDRVICIDATASFHRLALFAEYELTSAYDGTPTVEINGACHCLERFMPKEVFLSMTEGMK